MKSLDAIKKLRNGDMSVLKDNKWLSYLYLNDESNNINIEKFEKMSSIQKTSVLDYVETTLKILEEENIKDNLTRYIIEEVLCWSEVAKCGTKALRQSWIDKGFNLDIHNVGSAEIYELDNAFAKDYYPERFETVKVLIATHGYVGQYIRGEIGLESNFPIHSILKTFNYFDVLSLRDLLMTLNKCIIKGVSNSLFERIEYKIKSTIKDIVIEKEVDTRTFEERLSLLRSSSIAHGENFNLELSNIKEKSPILLNKFEELCSNRGLWYLEPATSELTLKEMLTLVNVLDSLNEDFDNISLINIMNDLYYDYKGKKKINIFKKRILEKVLNTDNLSNEHLKITASVSNNIAFINLEFSNVAEKLIDFCVAAEGNGAIYDKAIVMLYDLFELRRDEYDRFNNEEEYLAQMNESLLHKSSLLDYVVGDTLLDVGPGGGALLDLMEEKFPNKNVLGIDISSNVIESLNKKKEVENKNWSVIQGDALNLKETFKQGDVDTIVLSSIVHELFSYIPFKGKKFNYNTLKTAFKSLFDVLPSGGRIVIRDGVMSENKDDIRIIKFKNIDDIKILERYCNDFKGRDITFDKISDDSVAMKINDAMEFLYTYTWGEESYSHEINEQFGYFTPSEYIKFMTECLGNSFDVIDCKHYLQEGYEEHLLDKISFYDDKLNTVSLPDSTIILVLEKK